MACCSVCRVLSPSSTCRCGYGRALSVLVETNQVPREFWLAIRAFFHGTVAVEAWVDGLLALAHDLRPPPDYEELPGVAIGVFDNLSMQFNYGSYMREGGGGERKDMTNWLYCTLPKSLALPGFDAHKLASMEPFFRTDRSIAHFCRGFYLDSAGVRANRSSRWTKWLRAIQNGQHLARPHVLGRCVRHPGGLHGVVAVEGAVSDVDEGREVVHQLVLLHIHVELHDGHSVSAADRVRFEPVGCEVNQMSR